VRYVLYVLYIAYTAYTLYTAYNIIWLAYHSSLHGSTRSILDYAYINQLASYDSSPSSYNIVLKASVILSPSSLSLSLKIPNISKSSTRGVMSV